MKKLLLIALIFHQTCTGVFSQTAATLPASNNLSAERLSRIDKTVQEYIDQRWLAGAVAIVLKNGKPVYYKAFGYDDADKKTPMQKTEIFRIASQTKAITSVAIMVLYEQGKLLIDDPISKYIPEFKNQQVLNTYNAADTSFTVVPANREVTIRDLLTHSSGIGYAGIGTPEINAIYAKSGIPSGLGAIDASLLEKMKKLGGLPLKFQPGTKWMYGLNTDLLGCLVEVISGMNLEDFMRKNIFDPIGMNDTYFNVPEEKANRLATVYTEDSLHHMIKWDEHHLDIDPAYPTIKKHYFSGGAGLSSTAWDYAIFLQMMLNGGTYNGHRVLSGKSVYMMTHGQLDFLYNGINNFGLGFEIVSERGAAKGPSNEGSFSWGGYFGTSYWADPKEKLVCLFMTQQSPNSHGDIGEKFKALVYQAINN